MFGGGFFLMFFPVLDVFFGERATTLAFAGVLEFAGVVVGFASTQPLAVIVAGAFVDLRHLLGGSGFAGRGVGLGAGGGVRGIRVTLPDSRAAEQAGHGGDQDFSGHIFHRQGNFEPAHLWHATAAGSSKIAH
jgi:hypothetical protein